MNTRTSKLRLGPLPQTDSVKLTITITGALKAELEHYATLHTQAYQKQVDITALIPYMLETFMARDRHFKRAKMTQAVLSPKATPA